MQIREYGKYASFAMSDMKKSLLASAEIIENCSFYKIIAHLKSAITFLTLHSHRDVPLNKSPSN
jgi:hypothetical protein